jgi:hypothetical protein
VRRRAAASSTVRRRGSGMAYAGLAKRSRSDRSSC